MTEADQKQELFTLVRELASRLKDPDKRQLKFNDIVETALLFYANDPAAGVLELTISCNKAVDSVTGRFIEPNYVPKQPMWETLQTQYRWMLA